eukprot:1253292-Amphidinium_carterae.1
MLSGRSTLVVANLDHDVELVLDMCRWRLCLAEDDSAMELWRLSEKVPGDVPVEDWPGLQPPGEISEYQLLLRR